MATNRLKGIFLIKRDKEPSCIILPLVGSYCFSELLKIGQDPLSETLGDRCILEFIF